MSASPYERIVAAAEALLVAGNDLSTRRVADAAGVSTGTVSYYFPRLSQLIRAAAEEYLDGMAELLEAVEGASTPDAIGLAAAQATRRAFEARGVVRALRIVGDLPHRRRLWDIAARGPSETPAAVRRVHAALLMAGIDHIVLSSDAELLALTGESDPRAAARVVSGAAGEMARIVASAWQSPRRTG